MRTNFTMMIAMAIIGQAQTATVRPTFEVAVIKPATFSSSGGIAKESDSGIHDMRIGGTWSMQGLICTAYDVKPYQVSGADWMADVYFDIQAKLPEGATQTQIPLMLQSLLADRFHMQFHTDLRPQTVRALTVGKGGLKVSEKNGGDPEGLVMKPAKVAGRRGLYVEMSSFHKLADFLSIELGKPVTDQTGLQGSYDIKFQFPMDLTSNAPVVQPAGVPSEPEGFPELIHEVEKLGLKLESRKDLLKFIVIEHLERTATGN